MKRCLCCNELFVSRNWCCPACGFLPPERDGVRCFAPDLAEKSAGFDPSRYETINRFQKEHFWFRGRNELICRQLKKYFPDMQALLEIGCGTGQVLQAIRHAMPATRLCGTEIHTLGLAYAKDSLPEVEFLQIDARAIPFREEFDLVCAFDVLEHIEDDAGVFRQMYQACLPGGGIVVTVPQHPWLWSYKDEAACHKRRYTGEELQAKVRNAGFRVIGATSFVTLLLPLMYLSRLRQRASSDCDLLREFDISPLANRAFLVCSRIENAIIQMGGHLPCGGSLMLIGRKAIA
jgi:SAM-dependent methyltransferase